MTVTDDRPRCGDCPVFAGLDGCAGRCDDGRCYGLRDADDGCVLPRELWRSHGEAVQGRR